MRRWLHVWGPPLIGGGIVTVGAMGAVACGLAEHWIRFVPCLIAAASAFFATANDLVDNGPARRRDKVACSACLVASLKLADVTKDRDELRQALITLQLPPSNGDRP